MNPTKAPAGPAAGKGAKIELRTMEQVRHKILVLPAHLSPIGSQSACAAV